MTDFLDQKRREIDSRMKELKPVVEEYARLEAAAGALQGVNGTAATPAKTTRRRRTTKKAAPKRAAKKTTAAASTKRTKATRRTTKGRRAGRPKGSGRRSAEALKLVQGQPGITIPELASKMGIAQNYLYRVLPGLQQEKKVRKDGRGWHAAA